MESSAVTCERAAGSPIFRLLNVTQFDSRCLFVDSRENVAFLGFMRGCTLDG